MVKGSGVIANSGGVAWLHDKSQDPAGVTSFNPKRSAETTVGIWGGIHNGGIHNWVHRPLHATACGTQRPLPSEDGTPWQGLRTFIWSQGQNLALTVVYVPYSLDSRNAKPVCARTRPGSPPDVSPGAPFLKEAPGQQGAPAVTLPSAPLPVQCRMSCAVRYGPYSRTIPRVLWKS